MDCDFASFRPGYRSFLAFAESILVSGVLFLLVVTLSPVLARTQGTAAESLGSVEGRITCNDGGFPARSARVDLIPLANLLGETHGSKVKDNGKLVAGTDFDGYYSIPSVPPGDYLVIASLAGYSVDFSLVLQLLKQFPPDRQKELLAAFPQVTVRAGGAAREDMVIRRGAAISGRVTFDSGGNLEGTFVRATLISSDLFGNVQDSKELNPVDLPNMRGMTDDRGVYRIAGLSPGKYRISVVINHHGGGSVAGPLRVYAPESLFETKSRLIEVGEGDEISDVDISIPLRTLHSIGGTVMRGGVPVPKASISIVGQGFEIESDTSTFADGTYRYDLLPPGTYTIGIEDYSSQKDRQGASKGPTITIQLMDRDILDANLDLLHHAQAE